MQFSTSTALKAVLFLGGTVSVDAFWRMPCKSRTGLARIDPLVSFKQVADHAHAIHGGSGLSPSAGSKEMLASDCTSCEVSQDKSAYWQPALYFQHADTGKFEFVEQKGGMLVYYLLFPNAGETTVTAFPEGFEMIAGDTNQRNFSWPVPDKPHSEWTGDLASQAFLSQAALGFNCLNYAKNPEPSLYRHFLPDKDYLDANCVDGVRFELMFPSCWDGVHKDGVNGDKRSHVAYPSQAMTGECPKGFKTRLISMFFETIWDTYSFHGKAGKFVLANGDPTGYGYHGDFITGWDADFLQQAANTCTNPSGEIKDCPLFDIQSSDKWSKCALKQDSGAIGAIKSLFSEDVKGPMNNLPGNVQIHPGPEYVQDGEKAPAPSTSVDNPVPTLSHTSGLPIESVTTELVASAKGADFNEIEQPATAVTTTSEAPVAIAAVPTPEAPDSTPDTPTTTPEAPTTTPAPTTSPANTQSYFTTSYTTIGRQVHQVFWVEELVTVTASETLTVTVPGRKRHIHKHRPAHN